MKQVSILIFFCFFGFACFAQTKALHFRSYTERRNYINSHNGFINNHSLKEGVDTLTRLEAKVLETGDMEMAYELKLRIYSVIFNNSVPANDSIEYKLKLIATEADDHKLPNVEADALQTLGDYYSAKHRQSAAIEQYMAAYDFYKNLDGKLYTSKAFNITVLGGEFYKLEDFDMALRYFKEAKEIMLSANTNRYLYCSLYNTIGLCYRNMKIFDSALIYFQQCYQEAVMEKYKPYQGIAAGNIGITYFLQKKYDEAIPLLQKDIETSIATNQIQNAASSMATLATIYNYQHNYSQAERLLKQALDMCESRSFWPVYRIAEPIYKQLYIVYAAKKDFRKAYLYADSTLIAKDSVAALNNSQILAKAHDKLEFAQHKLESEKLLAQLSVARVELNKNRIIIILAISGVAILLIVILFISRLNNKVNNQKKELEKLNAVKDRLFSIIGHDLRAPVNSVVSFTQLLEQGDIPPEKLQKYAGVLKDTLGHTVSLMENLLNWARTQMQGYNPVIEKFDVSETAQQSVGLLASDANKKEIQVVNNISAGTVISADFNMVSLLIRNLLSNAIKYTPAGGTITLSARVSANNAQIKVRDTGIGISRELAADFNKSITGQTLKSTQGTNNEKGTGLGLMLCKDFAVLMHGKLTLESEPGKGSCFTVELPV